MISQKRERKEINRAIQITMSVECLSDEDFVVAYKNRDEYYRKIGCGYFRSEEVKKTLDDFFEEEKERRGVMTHPAEELESKGELRNKLAEMEKNER